ncbi:hypothetical protein P5673_027479 [Acropora cervicornis]|uniref:Uncharacterized protein n=1 Tax=Acropora cervicornis TaxID=6130 RepID=A0AAD9UVN1_ACRCE|nr:hypothetical protein P5673_027479 [Acropora cervicornis]
MVRASGNNFYLALLNVGNTPQEGHNTSPAQRMMSRSTRTTLPVSASLLKPHLVHNSSESILQKQAKQQRYYDKGSKTLQQLHEGDRVKIQPVTPGQRFWTDGRVVKQYSSDGKVYVRNHRHLRKYEPRNEVGPAVDPPDVPEEMPFTTDNKESIPPESHQGESEPQLNNGNKEALPTHEDAARFHDFVMD